MITTTGKLLTNNCDVPPALFLPSRPKDLEIGKEPDKKETKKNTKASKNIPVLRWVFAPLIFSCLIVSQITLGRGRFSPSWRSLFFRLLSLFFLPSCVLRFPL